jgi:hypothetical protein
MSEARQVVHGLKERVQVAGSSLVLEANVTGLSFRVPADVGVLVIVRSLHPTLCHGESNMELEGVIDVEAMGGIVEVFQRMEGSISNISGLCMELVRNTCRKGEGDDELHDVDEVMVKVRSSWRSKGTRREKDGQKDIK